jgi:hypothetical protein
MVREDRRALLRERLVHRTPGPEAGDDRREANWIYVRHWQTP